ncbi:MAG: hypothetical protein H7210_01320 [Pyrinomonadaceae bacterium]|nr:hypothetical protein [Phycisphaerales bacterium]
MTLLAYRALRMPGPIGACASVSLGGLVCLSGCASTEEPGHSKTVTKTTVETPTEKTTVTETHQKDTTITR